MPYHVGRPKFYHFLFFASKSLAKQIGIMEDKTIFSIRFVDDNNIHKIDYYPADKLT